MLSQFNAESNRIRALEERSFADGVELVKSTPKQPFGTLKNAG